MREHLFRGKTESGEWCYGDLRHDSSTNLCGIVSSDNVFSYVLPETICEYVELLDMNGVKIFENDIIVLHAAGVSKKPRRIVWFPNWFGYHLCFESGYGEPLFEQISEWGEVVGNIFDTPKKWKEKRDRLSKSCWKEQSARMKSVVAELKQECERLRSQLRE